MSRAVYPGSFDPITKGHLDVIRRGASVFGELIVAIAVNPGKAPLFTPEERMEMIVEETKDLPNVTVDSFSGLSVDYVKEQGASVILRGIRSISDFEYEFQMALTNRTFNPSIETVFVMTSDEFSFFSSQLIKEAAQLGGDVSAFVPNGVLERLKEKLAAGEAR